MKTRSTARTAILAAAAVVFLALSFVYNTQQNASHEDYRNSNFAKFWIAGHMITQGLNPYDPAQWHEQHVQLGAASTPDRIFLYPLPQALLLVPLAWLPASASILVWSFVSQVCIAAACYLLLARAGPGPHRRLFVPLVLFMLFFGPTYLTLQIGSIGPIALAVLVAGIVLLDRKQDLLAGVLLSLLVLKPSQGLPLLVLLGCWLLFSRRGHTVLGMLMGGITLLASGFLYDPQWIQKFAENSQAVSLRTLGEQSNIFSLAYLACGRSETCTWALGSVGALAILLTGAYFLWRHRSRWTDWQAFNLIIPLGFLAAPYAWSYDQLLYIIPIVWILVQLVRIFRSYVAAFLFLIAADVVSFVALAVQAYTHQDLLSLITTLLVLGFCAWLLGKGSPIGARKAASTSGGAPQEP